MTFLFWFSLLFIIYTYAGYPCLLFIWSKLFSKKIDKEYFIPESLVSIVIAVRNEEKYALAKLENLIQQSYPLEKMEIIFISDGSVDMTNDIIHKFINSRSDIKTASNILQNKIKLIKLKESKGKPNALNIGVNQASGEYIVFTDARQEFKPDVVRELIANFNDPLVGCVSGELVFYQNSKSAIQSEMGFYWNLEKQVRKLESSIDSVVGATGAIYAVKKSLFKTLPEETLLDDVFVPMQIVFQGYRNVFDSKAIAYDIISTDLSHEKRRKIRTLLGNYQLLQLMPILLSPFKNPIFVRFLSHKVFRLLIPFFFFIMLLASFLVEGIFYKFVLICSITAFIVSFIKIDFTSMPFLNKTINLSRTFFILNYFALVAFFYFIKPGKKKVW